MDLRYSFISGGTGGGSAAPTAQFLAEAGEFFELEAEEALNFLQVSMAAISASLV